MIPTGQDSLNTRSTLEVGGKTYAYYSLAQGGRGAGRHLPPALLDEGAARKPAAVRRRQDRHPRRPPGDGRLAEGAEHRARDPVPAGARADAGFHRRPGGRRPRRDARRDERARRRSAEDQSAGAGPSGHRPQRDGRRIRQPHRRSARTSSSNISATASATSSSNGAPRRSTISRSCRRAPASATRSTSSISRNACGPARTRRGETVAYPDTLVGTDSHTTMVNGLGVLGWGVGGIEAEAAMLGQPVSMLIPEVVGFRLDGRAQGRHHRDRPGADRHPDAARRRASSAASSNSTAPASTA